MEDKNISYIAFESIMARNERQVKRLIIALIISILLVFLTNVIWIYAWFQYDYVDGYGEEIAETEYAQDGDGINIIGDSNDVAESNNKN